MLIFITLDEQLGPGKLEEKGAERCERPGCMPSRIIDENETRIKDATIPSQKKKQLLHIIIDYTVYLSSKAGTH